MRAKPSLRTPRMKSAVAGSERGRALCLLLIQQNRPLPVIQLYYRGIIHISLIPRNHLHDKVTPRAARPGLPRSAPRLPRSARASPRLFRRPPPGPQPPAQPPISPSAGGAGGAGEAGDGGCSWPGEAAAYHWGSGGQGAMGSEGPDLPTSQGQTLTFYV